MFEVVPGCVISLGSFVSQLFLGDASSSSVAVIRADSSLTSSTRVVVEAFAFTGLTVAKSFGGAFNISMGSVVSRGGISPGSSLGASSHGTIMFSPGRVRVLSGAGVACAFVVGSTGTVSTASIGAVSIYH